MSGRSGIGPASGSRIGPASGSGDGLRDASEVDADRPAASEVDADRPAAGEAEPAPMAAKGVDADLGDLAVAGSRDLLRLVTCGSVDDGKSTLIGRLLHDAELVPEDQLAAAAAESRRFGTRGAEVDLALLLDGLQAEREQGITIDVAYRYFSSAGRRFIVADAPGHEQYTRNMATGASNSELAVVLVDARRGIAPQTRRHSFIASLLGIRHLILAVNKMDLVAWDEATFDAIAEDFRDLAGGLGFEAVHCMPISALTGANVRHRGEEMGWYRGPALLELLETIRVPENPGGGAFRMPVQWTSRAAADFRGFAGTIAAGTVRPGDRVSACPAGRESTVERIVTADGDLDAAVAGQSVTVVLADEIDVGRGDVLAGAADPPASTDQFAAHVLWMHEEPLLPERRYLLKAGTRLTTARVTALRYRVDPDTREHIAARTLALNEVGHCNLTLEQPIAFDPYREVRETGGFILIDRYTNATVGAGMIEFGLRRADNLTLQELEVGKEQRARRMGQRPCILWFTGLPASGKSTTANEVEKRLAARGRHSYLLDGDNVRLGLNRDLGFTDADRVENIRRIAEVAKLFVDAGLIVLVSFISPFRDERRMARDLVDEGEFVEVFVDTPLAECERRDPKGLYRRARAGRIRNFTGIDSGYEPPENPELVLRTVEHPAGVLADRVIAWLDEGGYL